MSKKWISVILVAVLGYVWGYTSYTGRVDLENYHKNERLCMCVLIGRWRHLVPKWQTMQLCAALGFSRLALLLRMYDIPLASDGAASVGTASDELINRQVQ